MATCFLCDEPISSSNDSREHIIPNSIGGIKKTRGFICVDCNSEAGETWDAALSEQMNTLSLFFRVVRDRGENKRELIETTAGEKLIYGKGTLEFYSPTIDVKEIDSGLNIQVSAKNIEQARQILTGLKRKHKHVKIDVESILNQAVESVTYPEGAMHFEVQWGGKDVGRSWVKTALALLSDNGIDPKQCEQASAYLLGDGEPCFGYYYSDDVVRNRPLGVPLHCIVAVGNQKEKTIQGYLEYFGMLRIVLNLSENYHGEDFKVGYAIDPTEGRVCDIGFDFQFSRDEIKAIYEYERYDGEIQKKVMGDVIGPAIKKQQEEHFEAVLEATAKSIEKQFANAGGEYQVEEIISEYMRKLEPHLAHWVLMGRK
ncbi:HNH endonuclease [Pseudomonas sp. LMG 31766]|uniref:HNH endonuclease n=1 Tax=Pseudomonas chaetocerotis TaxID=2758695 RepID=A0A931GF06_9PSED|nr:HNH endonuclease [Pseudomonas chaetocerotis]MBZ9666730.1 HNH endonuclease [Pseudomonas chaetocerotis]